jgi:4-hydroxybenzoyl-CoA reductase subunit beta
MLRLPRFSYLRPASLAEAVAMLADHGGQARVIAGGTDLLPKMKRRQLQPAVLVGIGHLDALRHLETTASGAVEIGASATLTSVLKDSGLARHQPGYAQAAGVVSTPALRNTGTAGGNLCIDTRCNYYDMSEEWRIASGSCLKTGGEQCQMASSSPRCWAISSSDTAPIAVALGATAVVVGPEGERDVPIASLFRDDGNAHLALGPDEILTRLRLPAPDGSRSSYVKLRRRSSMDFPLAGAAVALKMDRGVVEGCRLVLGAVASQPVELGDLVHGLVGQRLDEEAIEEVANAASRLAKPLDNADLSYVWRKRMVKEIVAQAFRQAATSQAAAVP